MQQRLLIVSGDWIPNLINLIEPLDEIIVSFNSWLHYYITKFLNKLIKFDAEMANISYNEIVSETDIRLKCNNLIDEIGALHSCTPRKNVCNAVYLIDKLGIS